MPEAVKETLPEAPQNVLKEDPIEKPCKEVAGRVEEASSETPLPVEKPKDLGEGEITPDVKQSETSEDGNNLPESTQEAKNESTVPVTEGNGTTHENDINTNSDKDLANPVAPKEPNSTVIAEAKDSSTNEIPSQESKQPSPNNETCNSENSKQAAPEENKTEDSMELDDAKNSLDSNSKEEPVEVKMNSTTAVNEEDKVLDSNNVAEKTTTEESAKNSDSKETSEKMSEDVVMSETSVESKTDEEKPVSTKAQEVTKNSVPSQKEESKMELEETTNKSDVKPAETVNSVEDKAAVASGAENQPSESMETDVEPVAKSVEPVAISTKTDTDSKSDEAMEVEDTKDMAKEQSSLAKEDTVDKQETHEPGPESSTNNVTSDLEVKGKEQETKEEKKEGGEEKNKPEAQNPEQMETSNISETTKDINMDKEQSTKETSESTKEETVSKNLIEDNTDKGGQKEEIKGENKQNEMIAGPKDANLTQNSATDKEASSIDIKANASTEVENKDKTSGNDIPDESTKTQEDVCDKNIKDHDSTGKEVGETESKSSDSKNGSEVETNKTEGENSAEKENTLTKDEPLKEAPVNEDLSSTNVPENKEAIATNQDEQKTVESEDKKSEEIPVEIKEKEEGSNQGPNTLSEPAGVNSENMTENKEKDMEVKKCDDESKGTEKNDVKTEAASTTVSNSKEEPSDKLNGEQKEVSNEKVNESDAEAGGSREIDPKIVEEVENLIRDAKANMKTADYFTAADLLGKACETAGKLYGDFAKENAELYFLYGCAMLECAKNENPVLGDGVKKDEDEADEADNEGAESMEADEVNADEKMEVEGDGEAVDSVNDEDKEEPEKAENGVEAEGNEESTKEGEEEDEDSSLKVAWEMFELAKIIFGKMGNDLRLSDTYIKLGEVGMESGHETAIEDMKNALEIRKKCASDNERLLAETHFNIGLAYATFQAFDEAISAFNVSKTILKNRIEKLKATDDQVASEEVKEITDLLPDLDEKIQDMEDSKKAKEKGLIEPANGEKAPFDAPGSSKPVSNISHLVKRKRKLEEVTSDLLPSSKQPCTENVTVPEPAKDSSN